jgi:hypothetical protein
MIMSYGNLDDVRQRVIRHYQEEVHAQRIGRVLEMAQVGPGAVVVKDSSGERDLLFDTDVWFMAGGESFSPSLDRRKLGVICGASGVTIYQVMKLGRDRYLHPNPASKEDVAWYTTPVYFDPITGEDLIPTTR